MRRHFEGQDFIEVDCGALQVSPGNEAHLHAFRTDLIDNEGRPHRRYLHTSPEFACKKLLAAGERRIFSLGHVFRNRERTRTHVPEFTMLEWYRAGEPYDAVIDDTVALIRLAATSAGSMEFVFQGRSCKPFIEVERLSVAAAFERFAGVKLLETLTRQGMPDRDALAKMSPVPVRPDDSWSDIFSAILVSCIEPHLGNGRITILDEYPACEAALARISSRDSRVSERFEAYACGVELANGFGELTDPVEQRRRFEADMDLKERLYGERYPIDESLIEALSLMPEASGVALGLDRLIMLASGAPDIDHVIWTPAT
jgi:lysyl-tRNA synthetase class 2